MFHNFIVSYVTSKIYAYLRFISHFEFPLQCDFYFSPLKSVHQVMIRFQCCFDGRVKKTVHATKRGNIFTRTEKQKGKKAKVKEEKVMTKLIAQCMNMTSFICLYSCNFKVFIIFYWHYCNFLCTISCIQFLAYLIPWKTKELNVQIDA